MSSFLTSQPNFASRIYDHAETGLHGSIDACTMCWGDGICRYAVESRFLCAVLRRYAEQLKAKAVHLERLQGSGRTHYGKIF